MKPNGTNQILSDENRLLKEKIKDLQRKNELLHKANIEFLQQIRSVQTIIQSIDYLKEAMDKKKFI